MTGDLNDYIPIEGVKFDELEYYYGLMNEVFRDHLIGSFNIIVDAIGETEALAILKPIMKHEAVYVYHQAKQNFGVKGNGLDTLLISYLLGSMGVSNDLSGEIMERGAVGITRNCILKDAPLSLCFAISHFASEGMCDAINPDYECIWTHHESDGDQYCRYVFKKRSDHIIDLDDLGASVTPITMPPIEGLPRMAMRRWFLAGVWRALNDVLEAKIGTIEARKILGENAFSIGVRIAGRLKKEGKIESIDLDSVAQIVDYIGKAMNQRGNLKTNNEGSVIKVITDCSNQNNVSITCWQIENFLNGLTKGLNPDLEFSYASIIHDGGKNCVWSLQNKAATESKELKGLKTRLLSRFVEGEISEEEYRKMKKVLEE